MAGTEPGRIPRSAPEIDPRWLEEALSTRHPGVRVADVEVHRRAQATNAHARLRVRYDDPGETGRAPTALFCKLLPDDEPRRSAIAATGMGCREALFYERLAPELVLRVPTVHAARHDPATGEFVLLVEDLVERGVSISDGTVSVAPDSAARALEDLAAMHVRFEDASRPRPEASWVRDPDPPSDYGSVRLREALERHRERLTAPFAEVATLYLEQQKALHALWHEGPEGRGGPKAVIHGDPHIGNLFDDCGRTGFLDWGLVMRSHPLRDVSYLLQMALSIEDRRRRERELLGHYLEVRAALGGRPIDAELAWLGHRLFASYLAPACCQIVTFPEAVSPARRIFSEAFLARAEAALEDLEVRDALRRHAGL